MDESQIRKIVQDEIAKASQKAQYTVTRTPVHTHNNIDSPNIQPHAIIGFQTLPGTTLGVADPVLLNGQTINNIPNTTSSFDYPRFDVYPLPVIYGYGTSTTQTLTGTPSSGATSATLTGNWAGTTGEYATQFDSTEIRIVTLTNGATTVTWSVPLNVSAGGTGLDVIANSRFHGGDAPYGTAIIFRNDDDGILQLWVRSIPGVLLVSWAGVELGGTGLFVYT